MTDRELLELAAKAADIKYRAESGYRVTGTGATGMPLLEKWNPLTDDGDALRLAVDLRLRILPGKHKGDGCTVETQRIGIAGCTAFYDDKAQQMRRAIVLAAAEIGKSKP